MVLATRTTAKPVLLARTMAGPLAISRWNDAHDFAVPGRTHPLTKLLARHQKVDNAHPLVSVLVRVQAWSNFPKFPRPSPAA